MRANQTVATFLHISDLHLGHIRAGAGAVAGAALPRGYRVHSLFNGRLGHHDAALDQLRAFHRRLKRQGPVRLVVTGDLTADGHPVQFAMAGDFLGSRLPPAHGGYGLADPDWKDFAVPGNHDHWPGSGRIVGNPTAAMQGCFHPLPWLQALPMPAGLPPVTVAGIDSDVDVVPVSASRLLANGSFSSHLRLLAGRLPPAAPGEVRVLVMHHSPSYVHGGRVKMMGIETACHEDLKEFLVLHGFRIVLSGHVHRNAVTVQPVTCGQETREILEARCASTTQLDRLAVLAAPVAPSWLRRGQGPDDVNSLMVHRLHWDGQAMAWETSVHHRTRRGFLPWPDSVTAMRL